MPKYTPTEWVDTLKDAQGNIVQKGTPITAGKLNKLETALAAAPTKETTDELATKLEEKAAKSEVQSLVSNKAEKTEVDEVNRKLAEKAAKTDVQSLTVNKAEVAYVNEKLNDLSVTQINKNKGLLDQTYLTDELKQQIAGTAPINAVPAAKSITQDKLADKAVLPTKTTFIKVSTNLIDKRQLTFGRNLDLTTGEPITSSTASITPFIPIDATVKYWGQAMNRRTFYDANKVFISGITGSAGDLTIPANAKFVRISTTAPDSFQLNEGTSALPYEAYYDPYMDGIVLRELLGKIVKKENIQDQAIGTSQLDFVNKSSNLINKNTVVEGMSLSATTGLESANSLYVASAFEPAKSLVDYTTKLLTRVFFYNSEKKFISQVYTFNETMSPVTMQSPAQTAFIRTVIHKNSINEAQLNEGSTIKPYDEYGVSHFNSNIKVSTANLAADIEIGSTPMAQRKYYIEDMGLNGTYTAPVMEGKATSSAVPMGNETISSIYGHYDALVTAYPNYVTKTVLGNDAFGNPIHRYDFKPKASETESIKTNFPKMLITSGTHGFERTAVWVLLQMMEEITQNWKSNDLLEALRWNAHFIIVPLVTPSSYRNATRKNDNGVDISRNFPAGWEGASSDPTSSTYRGTAPLSELEAQYVNSIMVNEKDLLYVCDFHNFHTPGNPNQFIWVPGATNLTIAAGKHLVSKMTRKWKKEYAFMPQDDTTMFGYSDDGAPGGTIAKQAISLGYQSSLFEICQRFEVEPNFENQSAFTIKVGVEAFTNWVLLMLKHAIMDYNNRT